MASKITTRLDIDPTQPMYAAVAQNIIVAYQAHQDLIATAYKPVPSRSAEAVSADYELKRTAAIKSILKHNPSLKNINPIFVAEADLGSTADELSPAEEKLARACLRAGHPDGVAAWPKLPFGYVLFGFAATMAVDSTEPLNILVYRGTATKREGLLDVTGWGTNVPCTLPTSGTGPSRYGQVQKNLFKFYKDGVSLVVTSWKSLASLTSQAVTAVQASTPGVPWLAGGHSLGGAMISLAVLDLIVGKVLSTERVITFTYGGLVIGDAEFKEMFDAEAANTLRVVNMCDFVPSFSSLLPSQALSPYRQVGKPVGFVWETGQTWQNHSMTDVYGSMVDLKKDNFKLLRPLPSIYPIAI